MIKYVFWGGNAKGGGRQGKGERSSNGTMSGESLALPGPVGSMRA